MVEKILEELKSLERERPYKVPGNPDTYSQYNEAWRDCINRVEEIISKHMNDNETRCPVGGVDRSDKVDKISIQNAVETPFWMAVWATEPERMIDVRMSYSDLKVLCDLIDNKRSGGWIPVEERLPGTQKVLITDGEIVMRGYRRPDGTWKYGVEPEEVFSKLSSRGVIAWQPLPEPYRPEEGEDNENG